MSQAEQKVCHFTAPSLPAILLAREQCELSVPGRCQVVSTLIEPWLLKYGPWTPSTENWSGGKSWPESETRLGNLPRPSSD